MAATIRALAPEAGTLAADCLGCYEVSGLFVHPEDITLSSVVSHHPLSHVCFHADHSQC